MVAPKWRVEKKWRAEPVDPGLSARIADRLRCSRILAELLLRRGVSSPEAAFQFLNPRLNDLPDPALMPGIDGAVERIVRALGQGEKITVFGDYDVDGVVSTALLLEFFRFFGSPVDHYIPSRLEEGYGMNCEAVRKLAARGTQLIVTVDNGSSSVEEVELARSLGIDVVVTDHHPPSDPPPRPHAFVNPWLPGSRYPFPRLAGAGVVFKLIWQMGRHFSRSRKVSPQFREFLMESLALVALATIADVVPLVGENRVLAHYGLKALQASPLPGLKALVGTATGDAAPRRRLESRDVAFRLGPCLNSAGRLGDADLALRLLLTRNPEEAEELIRKLVLENERRRRIEGEIHRQARDAVVSGGDPAGQRVIVVAGEGWHPGVIGIVASRLVEEFYRPTLLISLQGDRGKGSARSIPQVAIRDALERASGCLEGFGGHSQAAGVRVASSRVDELRQRLNQAVEVRVEDMVPVLPIDGEYDLSVWTLPVLREIARLAPFGEGNRAPVFATHEARVVGSPRLIGQDGAHLSFHLRQTGPALRAIAFGMASLYPSIVAARGPISIAYQPEVNSWRDKESVELRVQAVHIP